MMQGVVDRGTAQRIRRYGLYGDIAGKTGTTNKQADAWFIGYTPQLLAGTWVGCDDRFLRFNSEAQGQGSAAALPIWINFFHKVFNDRSLEIKQDVRFKAPVPFSDCSGYNANTIADPNDTTSVQTVPIDQTSGDIIEEVTPEAETQP
jgi:penicillin-binding protein 1A